MLLCRHFIAVQQNKINPSGADMNANAVNVINVDQVVENSRFGAFQFGLLALCGLCLIIDGFDVQAMGYVAPAIIGDWGVSKASLGPVFGAGLFGMLLGSLVLTPVGDRLGRRPVLIISTFFFAACMLLTTQVTTIDSLLVLRFITGFGLAASCRMPWRWSVNSAGVRVSRA